MSIWTLIEDLCDLHDGAGKLKEIVGHLRVFNNAANYNPSSRQDWDILNNRNAQLERIVRCLQRVRRTTRRLGRETGNVPNKSRELSRLFRSWADTYARYGEGSRQVERAQWDFAQVVLLWSDGLATDLSNADSARRVLRRQKAFYAAQADIFNDLKNLAARLVRGGLSGANQAEALAYMIDFETVSNLSRTITRDYEQGLSRVARWRRELRAAIGESDAWSSWLRNRREVSRGLQQRRAPN